MSLLRQLKKAALVHPAYWKLVGHYAANVERRHFTQCLRFAGLGGVGGGGVDFNTLILISGYMPASHEVVHCLAS